MIKVLELLSYKERVRQLRLFSPEKSRLRESQCMEVLEGIMQREWSQAVFSGAQ